MGTVTPLTVAGSVLLNKKGDAVVQRSEVVNDIDTCIQKQLDLGERLYAIKKHSWYSGFNSYAEYLESLSVNTLEQTHLKKLARLAEVMHLAGVERSRYIKVAIAKLFEIARLDPQSHWLNPENNDWIPVKRIISELVEDAPKLTLKEIKQHVNTIKGKKGDDLVGRHFRLDKTDAEEIVDPAIERARRIIGGTPSDGECLKAISIGYLEDPANEFLAEATNAIA